MLPTACLRSPHPAQVLDISFETAWLEQAVETFDGAALEHDAFRFDCSLSA